MNPVMISRRELEGLIVLGLGQLRRAEARFKDALARPKDLGYAFDVSLRDLMARSEGLEMLLGMLHQSEVHHSRPVAA
jgi:hypothetical protein